MRQTPVFEPVEVAQMVSSQNNQNSTDQPPPLIDKKWLCKRFNLILPSGYINYKRLYDMVLTAEVIAALGATTDEIRNISFKTFNRQQTLILIDVLGL